MATEGTPPASPVAGGKKKKAKRKKPFTPVKPAEEAAAEAYAAEAPVPESKRGRKQVAKGLGPDFVAL